MAGPWRPRPAAVWRSNLAVSKRAMSSGSWPSSVDPYAHASTMHRCLGMACTVPCGDWPFRPARSAHSYSVCRNRRSESGAWYRPILVPGASRRASAFSFIARSASTYRWVVVVLSCPSHRAITLNGTPELQQVHGARMSERVRRDALGSQTGLLRPGAGHRKAQALRDVRSAHGLTISVRQQGRFATQHRVQPKPGTYLDHRGLPQRDRCDCEPCSCVLAPDGRGMPGSARAVGRQAAWLSAPCPTCGWRSPGTMTVRLGSKPPCAD